LLCDAQRLLLGQVDLIRLHPKKGLVELGIGKEGVLSVPHVLGFPSGDLSIHSLSLHPFTHELRLKPHSNPGPFFLFLRLTVRRSLPHPPQTKTGFGFSFLSHPSHGKIQGLETHLPKVSIGWKIHLYLSVSLSLCGLQEQVSSKTHVSVCSTA